MKIFSIIIGLVIFFSLIVASVGGWITNIVKLAHMHGGIDSGMYILRVVGIFVAPLGVILGYL